MQAMNGIPVDFTDGVTATVTNLETEILTVRVWVWPMKMSLNTHGIAGMLRSVRHRAVIKFGNAT